LVSEERYIIYKEKMNSIDKLIEFSKNYSVKPSTINSFLATIDSSLLNHGIKLDTLLLRPHIKLINLIDKFKPLKMIIHEIKEDIRDEVIEATEILIKYSGYIDRELLVVDKLKRLEDIMISGRFNYDDLLSLSTEARQKLTKIQPKTIGQARRIPGVSPSDINVLLVMLGR
jgi:tRNA uridine 5-carboxymethylaminomethyl modification enzyme